MKEIEKKTWEQYFGEKPSIIIDIDDAELILKIMEQKIKNTHNDVYSIEKELKLFNYIKESIQECKKILENEIWSE